MIVARHALQTKQGVRIRTPSALGEETLMRQKGRLLHLEHTEGGHANVDQAVLPVAATARVRHPVEHRSQVVQLVLKKLHATTDRWHCGAAQRSSVGSSRLKSVRTIIRLKVAADGASQRPASLRQAPNARSSC